MSDPIERVRMSDGCDLWTTASGHGSPMVLCHGGPGLFDYLEPVARMVDDIFRVHRYDQRGSGRSCMKEPYSIARFVQDLDELRSHFGYERWIVGGHSWGADLSLLYALTHPAHVRAVVHICGTGLDWQTWKGEWHQAAESRLTHTQRETYLRLKAQDARGPSDERMFLMLSDLPNHADRQKAMSLAEKWAEEIMNHRVSYEVNRLLGQERARLDHQELILGCRKLDVPVLIVHGEGDPRPFGALGSMIEASPRATVEIIADAGHLPWLEQPRAVESALRRFLESV